MALRFASIPRLTLRQLRCWTPSRLAWPTPVRCFSSDIARHGEVAPKAGVEINWEALSQDDAELFQSLQSAVEALGEEATPDHPMVEVRDKLATAFRDKAALLKRNWTDEMFQEGEEMNEEKVAEIEAAMATDLGRSGGGLQNGQNLGNALDLVGVYMKNYKLDKADAVLARCGPFVSSRGGVWMIKWLNHVSTVRMKQSRHLEALEMLYELELYSPYNAEEAPEFFATLYRNLAWALKALGRLEEAAVYFARMASASQQAKGTLDWFDQWDIGKLAAARGFRDGDMDEFYRGRAQVETALQLQIEQEPDDLVMRAKVHDSLAECYMVVKEYPKAHEHYAAAYDLLLRTVGRQSPLFGKQARHAANLQIAQGFHSEALPFLGEALEVESSKDAVNASELLELVDVIVNAQQRASSDTMASLPSNHRALKRLQQNLKERGLDGTTEYAILCHKMSLLYLHEGQADPNAEKMATAGSTGGVRSECGVLVIDGNEALLGMVPEDSHHPGALRKVGHVDSHMASRTRRGGQSAPRFGRAREVEEKEFLRKVAARAESVFASAASIILGGPARMKYKLVPELSPTLRTKILRITTLNCNAGLLGLRKAAAQVADARENQMQISETNAVQHFLSYLQEHPTWTCYGEAETRNALELGAVKELLIDCRENIGGWLQQSRACGSTVRQVQATTDSGDFFCRHFRVAGLLRWPVQFLDEVEESDSDSDVSTAASSYDVLPWLQDAFLRAGLDEAATESLAMCVDVVLSCEDQSPEERFDDALELLRGQGVPAEALEEFCLQIGAVSE
ncbi:unnamed protein product [Effrenium voratum]|nr:unnamed protein product [Effrenium voratum]